MLVGAVTSVGTRVRRADAEAYVLGTLAGMVVWAVLLVVLGPSVLPDGARSQMREIAGFGLPAGLASMAMVGYGNIDYLILGAHAQPGAGRVLLPRVRARRPVRDQDQHIISRLVFPVYSRTEDIDHMRASARRVIRINAAVIYPLLALFIAIAPQLVPWLFGEQWAPAVVPAQILTVAGMARMINNGTPPWCSRPASRGAAGLQPLPLAPLGPLVLLALPYGLNVVCVAVAAFQVITLVGSYASCSPRLVGVIRPPARARPRPRDRLERILLGAAPARPALSSRGTPSPVTIFAVCALAAPLYLLTLRLVSHEAWNDLMLLVRRVLLRRGDRPCAGAGLAGGRPDRTRLRSPLPHPFQGLHVRGALHAGQHLL